MTSRDSVRERIMRDAWTAGFPEWPLVRRISQWFERNKTSFGLFVAWPRGERDDPVGIRAGVFTADSPTRALVVGWARLGPQDFERLTEEHRVLSIRVFGWLRIAKDVDPSLAARALESVKVVGVSSVPRSVRKTLAAKAV